MLKATDELLKDHKMIRKVLKDFSPDHPRFVHMTQTLHRLVLGHAWFEDQIFFPALVAEPLFAKQFMDEMFQEHKDIDALLRLVRKTSPTQINEIQSYGLQAKVLLETHFDKEEEALFPLAEKILDSEGLNNLAVEMRERQNEIRKFASI